ncbi:hypothetical protein FB645_002475 [Coemansia sp. IMI 203386]|nr:hypothetical protein FB645_002475 [Coemansia sp. IMI 203386]
MKFAFSSALAIMSLFAVPAIADVAGTRTIVISLTTDEQGQIVPVIMHKNSAGYEPVGIPSTPSNNENSLESPIEASVNTEVGENNSVEVDSSQETLVSSDEEQEDASLDSSKLETPFPAENTPTPDEQQTMPASPIAEEESQAASGDASPIDADAETTTPVENADSDSESDSDQETENNNSNGSVSAQETGKSEAAANRSTGAIALAAFLALAMSI